MAELTDSQRDRILRPFLEAYNAVHARAYVFKEDHPRSDPACDFLCSDPSLPTEPLKIQHTVASRDEILERHEPNRRDRIGREILGLLRKHDVRGAWITLDVDNPPADREEQRRLAYAIWMIIRDALNDDLSSPRSPLLFGYDRNEHAAMIDRIRPNVARLEVRRLDRADLPAQLSFQWVKAGIIPLTAAERVKTAVDKKALAGAASGKDVVLLVHFDLWPYDEELDLPEITQVVAAKNPGFREVWVVDDCEVPEPSAHRVWMRPIGSPPA
jgi:hypothetical protein